jgi:pimeloyl-ACP methyl ester carboxylesterase
MYKKLPLNGGAMIEKIINGIGCTLGQDKISPERKTIVFVHGAGGSHRFWTAQVEHLSWKYNALAINLPGHGLGRAQGETTIEGYVQAVRDLIEGLGVQKVVLAGVSMGGAITQQFALTYPEKLIAIILFNTGARMKVMPQIFDLIKKDFKTFVTITPAEYTFAKTTSKEIIASYIEEAVKRDPDVVYGDYQACNAFNLFDRVTEIKLPCLIFSGAEDKLTIPKFQDFLHEKIAGSRLIRLENAGHALNLEKPEEVNKAIDEFLSSLPE